MNGIDLGRLTGEFKRLRVDFLKGQGAQIKWVTISIAEPERKGNTCTLLDVAKWCPNVKELIVGRCNRLLGGARGPPIWDRPLLTLAQSCLLVEKLHLESVACSAAGLVNAFAQFRNLTHLALKNVNQDALPVTICPHDTSLPGRQEQHRY